MSSYWQPRGLWMRRRASLLEATPPPGIEREHRHDGARPSWQSRAALLFVTWAWLLARGALAPAQALDHRKLLEAQTFWDNRDWAWYEEQIPFFESPVADLDTTYYYRWEVLTKHLTYGSPNSGYSFTEFIDRPFWSGAYGSISCPAGHQLYEARWLKGERISQDYARYWLRTRGAQPRRYSTWLADSVWAVHQVHPDAAFTRGLLTDLVSNYEGWERTNFVPEVGLFWQTGHDDGMEFNINSRQTRDILRGAPGFRPTLNSYLWADARAIARIAALAGDRELEARYLAKADGLKARLQELLWDPARRFFFPMYRDDEEADGFKVQARTLTHQTGRFAGDPHGRELIGYVPWQFGLPDPGFEEAWSFLMDPERFAAPFGPTVTERRDPLFLVTRSCCWWSGQSWPYATTQTLVAFANLLDRYEQRWVTKADYVALLETYARTHRKDGKPYIAEAANPDTGSWEGYDGYNHSEHYFHSGFVDLVITGLVGLRPRDDDVLELHPLAPESWDYLALDDVAYRGRRLSILWDRTGTRYGRGPGLHVLSDGKEVASAKTLDRLTITLPSPAGALRKEAPRINYAVNNDGTYYPRVRVSHAGEGTFAQSLIDGNYWYHSSPPNRWTALGSGNASDWCEVDFGVPRRLEEVRLYVLDDGEGVVPPQELALQLWRDGAWQDARLAGPPPGAIVGRRALRLRLEPVEAERLRVTLTHRAGASSGLSEVEAWGTGTLPLEPAPPPAGNLALNQKGEGFPRASASWTSRFDKVASANDGIVSFRPSPNNRWTSYESQEASDWLEIDFGEEKTFSRVELSIYDDRGGVRAPRSYRIESWDGAAWKAVEGVTLDPAKPQGGAVNRATFAPVSASRVRAVFEHEGGARSGVTEMEVWR